MHQRLAALLVWLSFACLSPFASAHAHADPGADDEGGEDDGGGGGGGEDDGPAPEPPADPPADPPAGGEGDNPAGLRVEEDAGNDDDQPALPDEGNAGADADAPADEGKADEGKADEGKADDAAGEEDAAAADAEPAAEPGEEAGAGAAEEAGADAGEAEAGADAGEAIADDGSALEDLAEGDADPEALAAAVAGLDESERVDENGEPVDPALAAMLAEDFEGPLSDAQEDSVLSAWDNVEGVELDAAMRDEFKDLPADQFEALAEVSPNELAAADDLTPAFVEQLEKQAEAVEGLSPGALDGLAKVFIEILRKKLKQVREKVMERTIEKVRVKQEEKLGKIITILLMLSPLGLLLLLMPLVLKKKYPTQMPVLVRASVLAAGAFIGAMILFTGLLYVLRMVQNEAGMATNPQIRVVDASFDAVDRSLDEIAAMPGLLEVPLQQLLDGKVDSLEVAILENVKSFKEDLVVFDRVAKMFQSVNWLFGWVAIALTLLTIVLFLLTIKPTLVEIVKLPARAASGEVAPKEVMGMVGKRIGNEFLATICLAAIAVVIALVSGVIEARLVGPAMDVFVLQLLVDMQYVFVAHQASSAYIYTSMGCVVGFLVLNIAVVVMAGAFYVGKSQKILRLRFHDKVPLTDHMKFWKWGTIGLLWALILPYGVIRLVLPLSEWIVDSGTTGEYSWGKVLVAGPLSLVIGFVALFFVGQGLRGMLYPMKYKVPKLKS